MTTIIDLDQDNPDLDKLKRIAEVLRSGGLVVFPTETVYGLGTNAFNERAVKRIFEVKNRPPKPVAVIVSDFKMVESIAKPNEVARELMREFLPGPITVIIEKKDVLPDVVTAGLNKVGIRMPDCKIPLKLAELSGVPIATPSANISGKPSPTKAEHVIEDLMGKVDVIINGGETKLKIESTVVDTTTKPVKIVRVGAIPVEEIEKIVGEVVILDYKSYKPKTRIIAVFDEGKMKDVVEKLKKEDLKICVIANEDYECDRLSGNLLDILRKIDKYDVAVFNAKQLSDVEKIRLRSIADEVIE